MSILIHTKYRNIWKILFGLSLVLNLVIVVAVAGLIMRVGDGQIAKKFVLGGFYVRAMSHQDRLQLIKELQKHKNIIKSDTTWEKISYTSVIKILKSEHFDQKAFLSLLEQQIEHVKSRRDFVRTALIGYMSNMTTKKGWTMHSVYKNLEIDNKRKGKN